MPIHWVVGLSVGVPVLPHLPHLYCLENKTRGVVTSLLSDRAWEVLPEVKWGGLKWENCVLSLTHTVTVPVLIVLKNDYTAFAVQGSS